MHNMKPLIEVKEKAAKREAERGREVRMKAGNDVR